MDAFIGGVLAVNYEVIIWVTVMAIAIILEISTVNLITIWFGIGAVVAILLSYCGVPMPVQIIVFFIVSFACMLILKPLRDNLIKEKEQAKDFVRLLFSEQMFRTVVFNRKYCYNPHHI